MFIVVLNCFPLGSPATVYYSIRSVTVLGWFPLEMSHHVCLLLSSVVISFFPCVDLLWSSDNFLLVPPSCLFILGLSHFSLGSPYVFHGCPQSFLPWFPIMSVHSCPVIFPLVPNRVCPWLSSVVFPMVPHHVCPSSSSFSPWFPICLSLSSLVFPLVPHLFVIVLTCVPLGSPSVRHCPHLCSPWFPICLSLSSFVFPLIPHLFIVVLICVPLSSSSVYRCPQLCSP